ncbi:MAG: hypothetical protein ABI743_09590, partial [bacterium]
MKPGALLLVLLAGVGCRPDVIPPTLFPPDPHHDPDPVNQASVRLFPDDPVLQVGETRQFAETTTLAGVTSVEWDFDYRDGTFAVDRTIPRPPVSAEPLEAFFGVAGTVVVAVRAVYPGDVRSAIGTRTLTVNPSPDPTKFRPTQQDISERRFADPVYVSDYTSLHALGGQAIARNGDTLLAGYFAIKAGVPRFYVAASNDLGNHWGAPHILSDTAADGPFLDRDPQLALLGAGEGFVAAWTNKAPGAVSLGRLTVSTGDAPTLTLGEVIAPVLVTSALQVGLPTLVADPADLDKARLLLAVLDPTTSSIAVLAIDTAFPLDSTAGLAIEPSINAGFPISRLNAVWNATGLLYAYESTQTSVGGSAGGTTATRRLMLDVLASAPTAPRKIANLSGNPSAVLPFESRLAAADDRYWIPVRYGLAGEPDVASLV